MTEKITSETNWIKVSSPNVWNSISNNIEIKEKNNSSISKKQSPTKKKQSETHNNIEEEITKQNLYKTELCRSYSETGICKYGHKCQFAHGSHELRPVLRHPKYKTETCKTFATTGHCPYGNRCRFIHPIMNIQSSKIIQSPSFINMQTLLPQQQISWSNSWNMDNNSLINTSSPIFIPSSQYPIIEKDDENEEMENEEIRKYELPQKVSTRQKQIQEDEVENEDQLDVPELLLNSQRLTRSMKQKLLQPNEQHSGEEQDYSEEEDSVGRKKSNTRKRKKTNTKSNTRKKKKEEDHDEDHETSEDQHPFVQRRSLRLRQK